MKNKSKAKAKALAIIMPVDSAGFVSTAPAFRVTMRTDSTGVLCFKCSLCLRWLAAMILVLSCRAGNRGTLLGVACGTSKEASHVA